MVSLKKTTLALTVAAGAALAAAGCVASGDARPARADSAAPAPERAPAVRAPGTAAAVRFGVAPAGNEVRYRVREQLVGLDLPNDAVGKSAAVSGGLSLDADGRLLPAVSRFVVDASTFASDRDRRDGYVRGRSLNAQQYPTIELGPTELRGLTLPLPTSGTRTFSLVGDLTVRGVTRPTVWQVTARFDGGRITGTASTGFTFADFDLQQPRVPVVLSVADSIRLEYDFNLVRDDAPRP